MAKEVRTMFTSLSTKLKQGNKMKKFNEALDLLEKTGDRNIKTIMESIECTEETAYYAIQAYDRMQASIDVEPKPNSTPKEAIVSEVTELYNKIHDTDMELFQTSIKLDSAGHINLYSMADNLKVKLAKGKELLTIAKMAVELRDRTSRA